MTQHITGSSDMTDLQRFALLVVLACVSQACATNPVTGKKEFTLMSEAQEIATGRQLDPQIRDEMGVYSAPELQRYVEDIGLRLAQRSERPNLPWHFTIVDVPAVNAFALPGGYIYVTRGILSYLDSEAELAGVLGHEIGHVTARHAVQAYTKATAAGLGLSIGSIFFPSTRSFGSLAETGLGVLFLKYGREDELQADRLGVQYAADNDWDPAGVPGLLTTLSRIEEASDRRGIPNWLSTHPHPADRVEKIQETVTTLRAAAKADYTTGRDVYLDRISGLVFGDNPDEGIIRGDTFLHPEMRFALKFPEGWEIQNSKTQVVAKQPGADIYMLLELVENTRGRKLDDIADMHMHGLGFRLLKGALTPVNGLDAHIGTYEGSLRSLGRARARAAFIREGRNVYFLAGLAQPDVFDRVARDFNTSIESFRALSRAEASEIHPNRLAAYVVRAGDTWQSIAQQASQGNVKASTLAIMNGHAVNDQPAAGERIKVVVSG